MSQTYTIREVSQRTRDWEAHGKENRSYYIQVEGEEKEYELAQRRDREAPKPGDSFEAKVESREHNGTTYYKLVRAQQGGGGGARYSAEDIARMDAVGRIKGRCHAQAQALTYATIQAQRGKLPDTFQIADLKPIIDWFVADAETAR